MKHTSEDRTQNMKQGVLGSRKWLIPVAIVSILLVIGIASAVSRQSSDVPDLKVQEGQGQVSKNPNYVTSNAAGQTIVINRQTGDARPLTPEEASTLAAGLKQLLSQSTEGLVQVRHENGMVEMNLQGRFQDVLLAKKEADGTVSQSCVNNVEAAAAFFEIDPALLGSTAPVSRTSSAKPEIR